MSNYWSDVVQDRTRTSRASQTKSTGYFDDILNQPQAPIQAPTQATKEILNEPTTATSQKPSLLIDLAHRYSDTFKKDVESFKQDLFGVQEGALGGLGRIGMKKLGVDVPRGSMRGQLAGIVGTAGIAAPTTLAKIPAYAKMVPAAKTLIEGAIGSQLIAPEDFGNAKQRLSNLAIAESLGMGGELIAGPGRNVARGIKKYFTERPGKLESIRKQLLTEIEKTSGPIATEIKDKLTESYRQTRTTYGSLRDKLFQRASRQGIHVTNGEISDALGQATQEAIQAGVSEGKTFNNLNTLYLKYSELPRDGFTQFRDLANDGKSLWKNFSSGAKKGQFTYDDISGAIGEKHIGNLMRGKIKGFDKLQSAYSDFIDVLKFANKRFQPYGGEFEIGRGVSFLKNLGEGKLDIGEQGGLKALEQGTVLNRRPFYRGIGQATTQPIRDLSMKYSDVSRQLIQAKRREEIAKYTLQAGSVLAGLGVLYGVGTGLYRLSRVASGLENLQASPAMPPP